jgi:hypothetical protein
VASWGQALSGESSARREDKNGGATLSGSAAGRSRPRLGRRRCRKARAQLGRRVRGPNPKYRDAHVWYDDDKPDNFGSYKLLIADVIKGKLHAVPRGIMAAAGIMEGA